MSPTKYPFSEKDVRRILKARKFIYANPDLDRMAACSLPVTVEGEAQTKLTLRILSRKADPGIALMYYGLRIVGVNKSSHRNPDGKKLRGWHEHRFSIQHCDEMVVRLPRQGFSGREALMSFAFARWNIKVIGALGQQLELLKGQQNENSSSAGS